MVLRPGSASPTLLGIIALAVCSLLGAGHKAAAQGWWGAAGSAAIMLGLPSSFRLIAESGRNPVVRLRNDVRPFLIRSSPSDKSRITGRLHPRTRFVELLRGCVGDWCYVRLGSIVGWLRKNRFLGEIVDAPELSEGAAVKIAMPVRKPPVPRRTTGKREASRIAAARNTADQFDRAGAISLVVSQIEKKNYVLAGAEGRTNLPLRIDHDDHASIVGFIPFSAADVEALGLCVKQWCLVEHGTLRGWVEWRHLADPAATGSPNFRFVRTAPQNVLNIYGYPSDKANIAGLIYSPADNIEVIGKCSDDWCHILYAGLSGWARTRSLTKP